MEFEIAKKRIIECVEKESEIINVHFIHYSKMFQYYKNLKMELRRSDLDINKLMTLNRDRESFLVVGDVQLAEDLSKCLEGGA